MRERDQIERKGSRAEKKALNEIKIKNSAFALFRVVSWGEERTIYSGERRKQRRAMES